MKRQKIRKGEMLMNNLENIELYANIHGKYRARHWVDMKCRQHFMEFGGYVFIGDIGTGIWTLYGGDKVSGILRRFETEKFTENDYGYKEFGIRYNVQMLISLDGGKSWSYGGTGRFCKSEEEVRDYIGGFANERD